MPTASNIEFSSLVAILRIRLKKKVSKHQPIAPNTRTTAIRLTK